MESTIRSEQNVLGVENMDEDARQVDNQLWHVNLDLSKVLFLSERELIIQGLKLTFSCGLMMTEWLEFYYPDDKLIDPRVTSVEEITSATNAEINSAKNYTDTFLSALKTRCEAYRNRDRKNICQIGLEPLDVTVSDLEEALIYTMSDFYMDIDDAETLYNDFLAGLGYPAIARIVGEEECLKLLEMFFKAMYPILHEFIKNETNM